MLNKRCFFSYLDKYTFIMPKLKNTSKVVVFIWLNSGKMWLNFMIITHLAIPRIGVPERLDEYNMKAYVIHKFIEYSIKFFLP